MPKLKTHQAVAKRFQTTHPKKSGGRKKFLHRKTGQDHFNARESGKTTKNKRRDERIAEVNVDALKKLLPYS